MTDPPRTTLERIADVRRRLRSDVDCWVASSDGAGRPYLVPLSFLWTGGDLIVSTAAQSRTARNLDRGGDTRIALGGTRDVVLIDASVRVLDASDVTIELGDAFAEATGFDPRSLSDPYVYLALRPWRIQAWREENELAGRDVMTAGRWLDDSSS